MKIGLGIGIPFIRNYISSIFDPSKLFTGNTNGAWYDPSDINLTWRRNLLTYSEQFDNAFWGKSNATITTNTTLAPDGTLTADRVSTNTTAFTYVNTASLVSVNSQNAHTFSVYIKADSVSSVELGLYNNTDWGSGTATIVSGAGSLTQVIGTRYLLTGLSPDSWTKVSITRLAGTSGIAPYFYPRGQGASQVGDSFYIWGAQLELGSTATTYQRITDGVQDYLQYQAQPVLFQNAAGTTPVTAVEQPVGLMLDKSKGLVLGPDIKPVVGGWQAEGGTVAAGLNPTTVIFTSSPAGSVYQSSNTALVPVNSYVEISFTVSNYVSGSVVAQCGYLYYPPKVTANGVYTSRCISGGNGALYVFCGANTSATVTINSVRIITGNHAFNGSGNSANFPVLSARVNTYLVSELYSDGYWIKERVTLASGVNGPYGRTSTKVVEDSTAGYHDIVRNNPHTVGVSLTYVAIMKAGERNQGHIRNTDLTTGGYDVVFTLEGEGSFVNSAGAKGSWTGGEASIRHLGEGWYLCTLKATPGAGTNSAWAAGPSAGGAASYAGTTGSGIYLAGVDLRVSNDALNQPTYQRVNTATDYDTVGFKPYLRFNGTNQWLQTNSIDFTYGDKMFVSAGVRKLADQIGMVAELSASYDGLNGSFGLTARSGSGNDIGWASRGTTLAAIVFPVLAPVTTVASGIGNISAPSTTLRINGSQIAQSTASQGTGNYGNYPLYIGARAGSSLWFNGRLYSLIVAGKLANAVEITETEKYVNGKTAAY